MTCLMTTRYSITTASTKPIAQAKRFCGAPTHSGCCLRTIHCPRIRLGANFGLTKMRSVKSIRKATTNTRVGWKLPISQAFMNETMAKKNTMPAAARTVRSLSTGTA